MPMTIVAVGGTRIHGGASSFLLVSLYSAPTLACCEPPTGGALALDMLAARLVLTPLALTECNCVVTSVLWLLAFCVIS